jgi:thiol-disulfide isomerase/thioredoxin
VKPTLKLRQAMYTYGIKQKKDSSTIDKDVYAVRVANAQSATQFSLTNYFDGNKVTLKDYKGKLVLLTYWFPGCGPCRGEFPYLEATLKKFDKSKISYFGINMLRSQDEYVVSFMNATKYSFIPLKDDISWDKGNLKAPSAPTNYLIDEEGRIIYSGFQINAFNPDGLELMIADLLKINALNKRLNPD